MKYASNPRRENLFEKRETVPSCYGDKAQVCSHLNIVKGVRSAGGAGQLVLENTTATGIRGRASDTDEGALWELELRVRTKL